MNSISKALLAWALAAAIPVFTVPATAQQGRSLGAYGPVVLPVDRDTGQPLPVPQRRDLEIDRAVPIPTVMNGGGFGLSGTDYYSDGRHEGPLRGGERVNEYVLAPALRAAPLR